MQYSPDKQAGFTIIEMIVSLALFSVVITVSVGALLMLVATNDQLQGEQSVMTNLSFALDSMTREIRTGTEYYCFRSNLKDGYFRDVANLDNLDDATADCVSGRSNNDYQGIAFKEAGDSITGSAERILYYFDGSKEQIIRKVGNQPGRSIVSSSTRIVSAEFFVTDTDKLYDDGDEYQPTVTIFIEATDPTDPTAESHYVQTTITQRIIDI